MIDMKKNCLRDHIQNLQGILWKIFSLFDNRDKHVKL